MKKIFIGYGYTKDLIESVEKINKTGNNGFMLTPGFGDILRGTRNIIEFCIQNNLEYEIDFSNHPVGEWLIPHRTATKYPYITLVNNNETVKNILDWFILSDETKLFIITNFNPQTYVKTITPEIRTEKGRQSILNYLQFSGELYNKLPNPKEAAYSVIHIRYSDAHLNKIPTDIPKCIKLIKEYSKKCSGLIYICSDNLYIKELCRDMLGFLILEGKPIHSGVSLTKEDIHYTLLDFILMSRASKIISLGYCEGQSSFSKMISELYEVPWEGYSILTNQEAKVQQFTLADGNFKFIKIEDMIT